MRGDFIFLLFLPCILCIIENLDDNYDATIEFKEDNVTVSGEIGVEYDGTRVNITESGSYLVTGICDEGTINIYSHSVNLYLDNLELSSSITSPIYISKHLKDIKIIALNNVNISDYEEIDSSGGDCAAIKIKKKSSVSFYSHNTFYINSTCKNAIKGASQATLTFEDCSGKYRIDSFFNGIASEGLIVFNGGHFNISTEIGDAVQAKPDIDDTISKGEILVRNGTFYIRAHSDAFQAKNTIDIEFGNFDIKTEGGFNSSSFDKETGSSKGFKVTNDITKSEIIIHDGNFLLDTPDDSFGSNGDITLINGDYTIFSGDDGINSFDQVIIGEKNSPNGPNINIANCFEGIEGKSVIIYSGDININSIDDGINSAKKNKKEILEQTSFIQNIENNFNENSDSKTVISIYGGKIKIIYNETGLDSNDDINLLGGDISLIQGVKGDNSIEKSGIIKLSKTSLISIGKDQTEKLNEIIKSNQKYANYNGNIAKNKILKIKNSDKLIVKEITIEKDINYIFYTSPELNENFAFFICDTNGENEEKYNFNLGQLEEEKNEPEKKEDEDDDNNFVLIFLLSFFGAIILLIIIFFVFRAIRRNC